MIAIVGGSGRLGRALVPRLAASEPVRVIGRSGPVRADVRDPATLPPAVAGARVVISAMHGFGGSGGTPRSVDGEGNEHLIAAARAAGVEHVVLLSIAGCTSDHPIELFAMKHRAEQALRASGLPFTIVRATAFMELWLDLIAAPLAARGKTVIFGPGDNPINFVSVRDVAAAVAHAVAGGPRNTAIDVAGPEDLTFDQLVDTYAAITGATGARRHLSVPTMRFAAVVTRLLRPSASRQIRAAIVMATTDMRHHGERIGTTRLAEVLDLSSRRTP